MGLVSVVGMTGSPPDSLEENFTGEQALRAINKNNKPIPLLIMKLQNCKPRAPFLGCLLVPSFYDSTNRLEKSKCVSSLNY